MLDMGAGGDHCNDRSGDSRRVGVGRVAALGVGMVLALSLAGCSHLHWPWHHETAPPPEVHELDESAGASFPQYWRRNTLVVDLRSASGTGTVVLKPREGTTWPVRLAFKVTAGAVGELDIRAAQRVVLPVSPVGGKPIYLELTPDVYVPKTEQITVSWGPDPTPQS